MSDTNPRSSGWLGLWCLLVGVILLATGLFFVIGGYKLVSLGGKLVFPYCRGYYPARRDSVFPPQVVRGVAVCSGIRGYPDLGTV